MAGYYDIVLGLIPVALLGITAALTVVGVSLTAAVPVSAAVAIVVIGHAMFVNAPIETIEDHQSHPPATQSATNHPPVNSD